MRLLRIFLGCWLMAMLGRPPTSCFGLALGQSESSKVEYNETDNKGAPLRTIVDRG